MSQDSTLCPDGSTLTPLKTILELRAGDELVDVYVTRIPAKSAHKMLTALRSLLHEEDDGSELQHLRRVAKGDNIPEHVRATLESQEEQGREERISAPEDSSQPSILLLICPTRSAPLSDLHALFPSSQFPLMTTKVPLYAPTSAEQAVLWSKQYWPAVYKRNNPFGPHPPVLARAADEIKDDVSQYLNLAHRAALQVEAAGLGRATGAVVVDRTSDSSKALVLAAAGDARWKGNNERERDGTGNIMAHAPMRAIGMVAKQLCRAEARAATEATTTQATSPAKPQEQAVAELDATKEEAHTSAQAVEIPTSDGVAVAAGKLEVDAGGKGEKEKEEGSGEQDSEHLAQLEPCIPLYRPSENDLFHDTPLVPTEQEVWDIASPPETGYLCNGLEIYLTHEPCVMCSMAINHSRFAKVVFERRMPRTGGLCSEKTGGEEGGLGHGLFWRKELNWSLLAWQWRRSEAEVVEEELANAIAACDAVSGPINV